MKLFKQHQGSETDMHADDENALQPVADSDELKAPTFDGLHHLYFTNEASALRASLDIVATRTQARTARDF